MLQAIRGKAGSWVVKILFAFLILSFGVWGIGDLFRGRGPDQTLAEIGDVEIPVAAVEQAFRQNVDRMRQLLGPEFDTRQAVELGLLDQAVDQVVTGALLDQIAAETGVVPTQESVVERIRSQPVFQDQSGRFSRDVFLRVLAANGLSEQGYIALLRRDLAQQRVAEAVGVGAGTPGALAENIFRYRNQTRTAAAIGLTPDLVADLPAPTESGLRAFYEANDERFTAAERRALTVVTLSVEDTAEEITIGEDALRDAYEARLDQYEQPAMRSFDQVVVQERATAQAIAEAARQDGTLADAIAATEGADAPVVPLDWTTKEAMLPQLADAGFGLPEDGVSDPVQSPFGWHVLEVTGVRQAGTRSFEEVRDELEAELKRDRALDRVFEVANEFEDALAAGIPLEEAARDLGLDVVETPPLARDGSTADDADAPDLPAEETILETAFMLAEGETSGLEDTPEGLYYAVRVDEVVEPAVRPFDEVRDEVVSAWTAEQHAEALAELASAVADRLRNGEDPAAVAESIGAEYERTPALLRDGSNRGAVPQQLVQRLFEMDVNEVAVVPAGDRQIVARLTEVAPAAPAENVEALADLQRTIEQSVAQDLMAQFTQALRDRYEVEINREALRQVYDARAL